MNIRSYLAAKGGNVATMFALSVVPMTLIAGFAIDFGRLAQERNRALAVIDAATLSAVRETADASTWEATITAMLDAHNVSFLTDTLAYSYTADPPTMEISGRVEIETGILAMLGLDTLSTPIESVSTRRPGMLDVDVAFAFDATGSMTGLVTGIKENLANFHADLAEALSQRGITLGSLRVRPTVFRDVLVDGSNAMIEADFFELPLEAGDLDDFLAPINAGGGGDQPESGLVALRRAFESDWREPEDGVRRLVVVWTDAPGQTFTTAEDAPNSDSDYERCVAYGGHPSSCPSGGTTYAQALDTIHDLYDAFHSENIAVKPDVESILMVNERRHLCPWSGYYSSYYDRYDGAHSYCWPWENEMENWDGAAYQYYTSWSSSADQVYADMIENVANTLVVGEAPRISR